MLIKIHSIFSNWNLSDISASFLRESFRQYISKETAGIEIYCMYKLKDILKETVQRDSTSSDMSVTPSQMFFTATSVIPSFVEIAIAKSYFWNVILISPLLNSAFSILSISILT